ncbi:hypothetical protein AT15_09130 [Kosmotoga arenicorallina S304]|uniref:Uncharacterized protein n=1 Tax=Kosmotoga arenicorallina S304 TaxID=1453497 RepID=A0A176K148_9BACT|nr:hypothetical protein AT15_09130 [Kosmotoga arenicorallina S304]
MPKKIDGYLRVAIFPLRLFLLLAAKSDILYMNYYNEILSKTFLPQFISGKEGWRKIVRQLN